MSRRRVAMLVAMVAALAGAPSSVSAAPPNALSQASVAPASGGPSTLFVVSVRYRSPAGNAATTVVVNVGNQQVAVLHLVSGTLTNGTWTGTTVLPPGVWDITVRASTAKGPAPSLLAGTVSVSGATAPPTPPSGGGMPSTADGPGNEGGSQPPSPVTQPIATPPPSAVPSRAPARSSTPAAPSQPPTGPATGGATPAGPGRSGGSPARSPRANPTSSHDDTARTTSASPSIGAAPASNPRGGDVGLLMLIGTLAVGTVALVGSAWVFLAGRREREAALAGADARMTDRGVMAATIVEQRARRRARLGSTDDPILAAMGLPKEESPTRPVRPARTKRQSTRDRPQGKG